jgi:DNA-directed RNA polymerase specialized sigma24 family protein
LKRAAAYWARHHGIEADDLLQECLEGVLDGSRTCPAHVPIFTSLAGVMRSIGSGWRKARIRRPEVHLVANDGQLVVDLPDDRHNAEEEAEALQEEQHIKQAILALFEDDLDAQLIVEGDMDGIQGEELRDLTGMDHKAFASKRRLIRRRIDKKFPQGWVS